MRSLGRFSGEPRERQREQVEVLRLPHSTVYVDQPRPKRGRPPRGETFVRVFEYAAAALLAAWLVTVVVGALDQMLAPPPAVFIGPDAEPWP